MTETALICGDFTWQWEVSLPMTGELEIDDF